MTLRHPRAAAWPIVVLPAFLHLLGCGQAPPAPSVAARAEAQQPAAQPTPAAAPAVACAPGLGSTVIHFASDPRLERYLRSDRGPLPMVTYGPRAQARDGDENRRQTIRFYLPDTTGDAVYLQIFDADTGWKTVPDVKRPWDDQAAGEWDGKTRFRLFGKAGSVLLQYDAGAGKDTESDQRWIGWGPIPLACAERVDSGYAFALEVEGLAGDDGNAYLAGLSTRRESHQEPAGLRATAEAPTVRLVEADRAVAELLFTIPPASSEINIHSFDLARGPLLLETAHRSLPVVPSGQGEAMDVKTAVDEDERGSRAALVFAGGWDNPNDVTFSLSDQAGTALELEVPGRRRAAASPNRPPVVRMANAVGEDCRTVSFDATRTIDPDGDALTFAWDFGDGNVGAGARATHVYAEPGAYAGRLLVRDDSGAVLHAGRRVFERRIWARPLAVAGGDRVGAPGVPLGLDGSASRDPDGGELRYRWSFGDGQSGRGAEVEHRWRRPGTYRVELAVVDDGEAPCHRATDTVTVVINARPRADAGVTRLSVAPGDPIPFDGSGSRDPEGEALRYRWEFGDAAVADLAEVTHRYAEPGTYRATLTVTDPSGAPNASDTASVEVFVNAPPRVVVSADLPVCARSGDTACFQSCSLAVALDGASSVDPDGDRLSLSWRFGDGTTASGARARHVFADDGQHVARLTADDGRGLSNSRQTTETRIDVHRPPRAAAGPAERTVGLGQPLLLSGAGSTTSGAVALRYHWDFDHPSGEPAAASAAAGWDPTAVHRYLEPAGDRTARLTVIDDSGFAECRTGTVDVRVRVVEP